MSSDTTEQLKPRPWNGYLRQLKERELENIEPCINCMSKALRILKEKAFQVVCRDCGMRGPNGDTRQTAICLWDSLGR